MNKILLFVLLFATSIGALAQRKVEVVENQQQTQTQTQSEGMVLKRKVAISRFSNETQYAKGIFYDKENDPVGKQALDILSAKLAASGKFLLFERSDLDSVLEECKRGGQDTSTIGVDYLIFGSITEFGRKNTGKNGVFTTQRTQTVDVGVSLRLVDVSTGLIVYTDEGRGSAEVSSRTALGVGGRMGYDATLADKAISEAIGQLVENIINKCTDSPWKTYFIVCDAEATLIAGGSSQGIQEGMTFDIKTAGKKVKNPQTGITITLPGKKVGTVRVLSTGGDTPETEYSFVEITSAETINSENMHNYIIEQQQ